MNEKIYNHFNSTTTEFRLNYVLRLRFFMQNTISYFIFFLWKCVYMYSLVSHQYLSPKKWSLFCLCCFSRVWWVVRVSLGLLDLKGSKWEHEQNINTHKSRSHTRSLKHSLMSFRASRVSWERLDPWVRGWVHRLSYGLLNTLWPSHWWCCVCRVLLASSVLQGRLDSLERR